MGKVKWVGISIFGFADLTWGRRLLWQKVGKIEAIFWQFACRGWGVPAAESAPPGAAAALNRIGVFRLVTDITILFYLQIKDNDFISLYMAQIL
jgi:hypothetical protein